MVRCLSASAAGFFGGGLGSDASEEGGCGLVCGILGDKLAAEGRGEEGVLGGGEVVVRVS